MKRKLVLLLFVACLVALWPLAGLAQQKPKVAIPDAKVPQIMTMEGMYVRAAYNNEGYAILGYRVANESVGENWLLLEIGLTLREGVKDFTLLREFLTLSTPDGNRVMLPSQDQYLKADLRALELRASVVRDSINYFPPMASGPCRIGFFAATGGPAMSYNQVDLNQNRACMGRIYFQVPGGIKYGQYFLNVQFRNSLIRVPFRILTKDEQKEFEKNYKDIEKQVKEAFQKK